ncbi:MAG: RNA polymerase sigma factor [Eubacterium sp.]|nr:RNA polymerase sigma factor [Eubacterium sp.]
MNSKLLQMFFEQYHNDLYIYLRALCHDPVVAEDLLQETFLKAILSLPDDHVNVRAWLYMVARNLYYNYAARRKHQTPLEEWHEVPSELKDEVLEQMLQDEQRMRLHRALEQLSETRREVLVLQYFGGFSQKEIASMMQLSPENVRVLGHRAKKDLKRLMEEKGNDI